MVTFRSQVFTTASLLLIALLLCSSSAFAQAQVRGFLDVPNEGPLVLVSDQDGFSFRSWLTFRDWLVGPSNCNGDPNACSPGKQLSLSFNANSESGPITYQGHNYTATGGVSATAGASLTFDAQPVTLPDIAPTATLTTTFSFSGNMYCPCGTNGSETSVALAGSGTVTVFLHSPSGYPGFPNSWHVDRVYYQFDQGALPGRWTYADVGTNVGQQGSSHFFNGQFFVNGSGGDIWGTDDGFQFLFSSLEHGQNVVARVDSLTASQQYAKAGVMIRTGMEAAAGHVMLDVKPDGGVEFMTRSSPGGSTSFIAGASATFPVWLRLSTFGSTVVGTMSSDGVTWTPVGSTTFAGGALGGLVVTSHDRSSLAYAVFEEPTVGLDWPWYHGDVGSTGIAGNAEYVHGAYLVSGSGADIWGAADAFQFLYGSHPADGAIVARIDSEQDTNPFAKAGVMIRNTTDANAPHVVLDVRPNGSVEFMARTTQGGVTNYLGGTTRAFPVWLKLERRGTTITGSTSADGTAWANVASIDLSVTATLFGVAVTSHDTSMRNTAAIGTLFMQDISSSGTETPPPPPSPPNVVIYASDVASSAMHGVFAATSDATAANGVKLTTPAGSAANASAPLASPADYVDIPFTTATNTPYTLWIRLKATNNSKYSDSLWVQFSDAQANGAGAFPIGTTSGLLVNLATDGTAASVQNWGWVDGAYWLTQPATFTFSTTQHTLRIQPREYGVQLDQIVLSPSNFLNPNASCPTSCGFAPGGVTNDTTIVPKPAP